MSNATDEVRSTRSDARAFAAAFAAADDAFTFGAGAGESRELTLAELGEVFALDGSAALPGTGRDDGHASRALRNSVADRSRDDDLLTLDELGDALTRPIDVADGLEFDFGTKAHERARRRTAARLDAAPSARRRMSGSSSGRALGQGHRPTAQEIAFVGDDHIDPKRRPEPDASPAGRSAMASAAASAAERLAGPERFAPAERFARSERFAALDREDGQAHVASRGRFAREPVRTGRSARHQRPDDSGSRPGIEAATGSSHGKHTPTERAAGELTGRFAEPSARLREVERPRPARAAADLIRANPDRIAMWAVLLGIVLVLIAFTSGSANAVALPLLAGI